MVPILLALILSASLAQAATITVTSFNSGASNPLTTNEGSLLGFGSVSIGSFNVSDAEVRSLVAGWNLPALQAGFQQFGRAISLGFNGLPGLYQDTVTAALPTDSALAGKQIYSVISDGFSISGATGLIIYKHAHQFAADPEANEPALLNAYAGGELLVGDFGKFRKSLGQIVDAPVYSLAVRRLIPEPATTLLLALGACAFWRRKRAAA